jgi:hypothetical protein
VGWPACCLERFLPGCALIRVSARQKDKSSKPMLFELALNGFSHEGEFEANATGVTGR